MANNSHHRIKLWLHTCAFIFMGGVMGCALIIASNPVMLGGASRTPMSSRVGMSMAGKGFLFLTYQILTENVRWCKRAASTKANKILNCIETVAWCAATGVTVYSIMQFCIGISCTLSYVMIPLCAFLVVISAFSAWISIKEHRHFKQTGIKPGDMELEAVNSEDSSKLTAGNGISLHQVGSNKFPEPSYSPHRGTGVAQSSFGTPAPNIPPRPRPQQQQSSRQHHSRRSNEHYTSQGQHQGQFGSNHHPQHPYDQSQYYPQQQQPPYPSRR